MSVDTCRPPVLAEVVEGLPVSPGPVHESYGRDGHAPGRAGVVQHPIADEQGPERPGTAA